MKHQIDKFPIGTEAKEPNWPLLCVVLTGCSMRALGYLESGCQQGALEALREAAVVLDVLTGIQLDLPVEVDAND